jgi:hypothetical protein
MKRWRSRGDVSPGSSRGRITLPRKATERNVETTWKRIALLNRFISAECANYIRIAGDAAT